MTSFDLPPEQLLAYRGRNPRPEDHTRYWAQALAELDAVDPAVSLVAHPHPATGMEGGRWIWPTRALTSSSATSTSSMICPPSSQYASYNKIQSAKQLRTYPDFGHEPLPGQNDAVFAFMAGL